MVKKNWETPLPLFDTLENLKLHAHLPLNLPKTRDKTIEDYQYAVEFLYSYRGSEATFNAYRREIERLLQWSWFVAEKSLSALSRSDIEAFIEFCQNPPLHWIGLKNVARFVENTTGDRTANPDWRPFVASVPKIAFQSGERANPKKYVLSQKAIQAIFAIVGSFFSFLIQENYVSFNPVAQIRQKSKFIRKQQSKAVIRRLTELQWDYVIETAQIMAKENPSSHERTLFIMSALYGMYLRISELVASSRWQPTMGDFHQDSDGNWWFKTVGKGNKERIVSVSDNMLDALRRYRIARHLSPLPLPGETTPLITHQNGKTSITSTRQIRMIVQQCFDTAMQRLMQDQFLEEAEALRAATVHWLRHTGISDDVKHRPREHVRDDAGHSSSATTDRYIDVAKRERHASARKKRIRINEH